jgi:ATP-dependent Clp protease ATP-binding subunit ClpA
MVIGDISLTPRAKKVIELAAEEAQDLNHNYIGTEHLLLGLIREGEGIAVGVLESLGVDLQKARAQVITVVSQTSAKAAVGQRGQASPASTVSLADVTGSKDNVITCRIPAGDLEAIDALIEAGIRSTRSDAASWLIHAGIQANLDLFDKVYSTVAEIRRLREQAQTAAKDLESKARPAKPDKLDKPEPPEAPEMPDTATPPPTES